MIVKTQHDKPTLFIAVFSFADFCMNYDRLEAQTALVFDVFPHCSRQNVEAGVSLDVTNQFGNHG